MNEKVLLIALFSINLMVVAVILVLGEEKSLYYVAGLCALAIFFVAWAYVTYYYRDK